uniref:Solute carrier organic anion transporter family member n=1 Tax=Neogobius melanostomus TaxID=47308 RepID=A0A8C6WUR9_9GOBI
VTKDPLDHRGPDNGLMCFFVLCHSALQLSQLLVSGYMKSSISTIERRYGLSSQRAGMTNPVLLQVGNTVLIVFVSFLGSRVHRPRFIAGGAVLAAMASLLMTAPHFIYGPYEYTDRESGDLCQSDRSVSSSNQSCGEHEASGHQGAYPLLLLGQLLLGIGAVPIQPFGISYIDDFSSKRNSPLYLGILLAVTSIGPAFGFMTSALTLRIFVDFNTVDPDQVSLEPGDLRWVGAWWLGFLVASCLLLLTAVPIMFFPRDENTGGLSLDGLTDLTKPKHKDARASCLQSFPRTALRTLKTSVYLAVVLAQVSLAAVLSGLATFMPKFMEPVNMALPCVCPAGGVALPFSILGIVLGGVVMRRRALAVVGAGRMCFVSVSLCVLTAVPLVFIGCSTQHVHGVYSRPQVHSVGPPCGSCLCPEDSFNPVCGSDGVEFRSPCHAGCTSEELDPHIGNLSFSFSHVSCFFPDLGFGLWARPGTCGSPCSHLFVPFMVFVALTCFIASFCHTPSYIIILRSVPVEDKSFAVGLQYMFFRVLAFMPGPVLYGKVIDTTCLLWGQKCQRNTSCLYYDLDLFRHRFLGLQLVFFCSGWFCFLVLILLQKRGQNQEAKPRYELAHAEA